MKYKILKIQNTEINFRKSLKAKNISIRIKPFEGVLVTVPRFLSFKIAKDFVESKLNESNTGHVTEQGDVETWHGKLNVERVDEYVKETVEYLESLKK